VGTTENFLCNIDAQINCISVNLQDVRKGLADLREGLKRIRQELGEHFADMNEHDKYGKQMWAFVSKANVQMEDLVHDVNNADSMFTDVLNYYGEEDKNMSSSEFYAIFKTFVTSYKVSSVYIYYAQQYMNWPLTEVSNGKSDRC